LTETHRKLEWRGKVVAVQPRIRLMRSFDERSHSYLGYVLKLRGSIGSEMRELTVAVGKAAHQKNQFRAGDQVSGRALPVSDPRLETAELYKASALQVLARVQSSSEDPPPFLGVPSTLEVYRARGHRRLAARTYDTKCSTCIWACQMAVEMIVDHWNPSVWRYRRETFCYGPKSCSSYKAGPTRKVLGRKGMSWEEEDWVDDEATAHRGPDD
jgi:hypothetical protein